MSSTLETHREGMPAKNKIPKTRKKPFTNHSIRPHHMSDLCILDKIGCIWIGKAVLAVHHLVT